MTEEQLRRIVTEVVDDRLKENLEKNNAALFGQLTRHGDQKIAELRAEMTERFDRMEKTLDVDTKRTETDEQERVFLTHQVDRHEGWIGQLAESTGTKLVPEL